MAKRTVTLVLSIIMAFSSAVHTVFAEDAPEGTDTAEEVIEQIEESDPAEETADTETETDESVIEVTEEEEPSELLNASSGSISGKVVYNSGEDATFNFDITLHLHDKSGNELEYSCVLPKGSSTYEFKNVPDGEYSAGATFGTERDGGNIGMGEAQTKAVVKNGSAVTGYTLYATWTYDMWKRWEEDDLVINKNGTDSFYVVTSGNTMELIDVRIMDMKFNVVGTVDVKQIGIDENALQYVYPDPAPVRALDPGDYQFMIRFKKGASFKDFKVIGEKTSYDLQFVEGSDGKAYWFENGVKQGTYDDPQGVMGDGTVRGREIYDEKTGAWYWLDSVYDGAKATGKEVWMPYIFQDEKTWKDDAKRMNEAMEKSDTYTEGKEVAQMGEQVRKAIQEGSGKWVRYDENGMMMKGWVTIEGELANLYPSQRGNTYYYDYMTGLMAKGWTTINGQRYFFDEISGKLLN